MVAHATSALDRLFGGLANSLTPEAAQNFVQFKVDAETQALLNDLADKAATGTLSEDERASYIDLVEAIDLVGIFQAKARDVLARQHK